MSVRRESTRARREPGCEAVLIPLVLEGGKLREDRSRPPLLVPLGQSTHRLLGCKRWR